MFVRVVRQGENLVLVIPKEMFGVKDGAQLELVEIKPGIYSLVSPDALAPLVKKEAPLPAEIPSEKLPVSFEELGLLKKMAAMPMESRTIKGMGLSGAEQMMLNVLKKRGFIFFSEKKYPGGVYGLSREAYEMATRGSFFSPVPSPAERLSEKKILTWDEHLAKYGYVIIENEVEARDASLRLEQELRTGEVLGTRGFDKKYYVAQKRFYSAWNEKIRPFLKEKMLNLDQVAEALSMSEVAARVALELMREQGEIIEKKKGWYSAV